MKTGSEHEAMIREWLKSDRIDRRTFIGRTARETLGAALGVVLGRALADGLTGPWTAWGQGRKQVVYMGWGGAWQNAMSRAYFEPYTRETKIPVTYVTPYDFAKIKAMEEAGRVEVDTITTGSRDFPYGLQRGYYQKLDFNLIDRSKIDPAQIVGGGYGIKSTTLSYVLTYNAKKWPGDNHPRGWADFWDVKRFPGPRTMYDDPQPSLEAALLADGVPKEKLYPLDVERALKKLDQIRKFVAVWWKDGSQSQQLIQNQEVDIAMLWNGRASDSIINFGAPYKIDWTQAIYNGASSSGASPWVVMRGAPNRDNAMRLASIGGQALPQAIFAKTLFYGPTNPAAFKLIDNRTARELPSYPENLAKSVNANLEWWADNIDALEKRWIAWKLG